MWEHTHSLIQREKITTSQLIEKSIDLARTVKDFDPETDVFRQESIPFALFTMLLIRKTAGGKRRQAHSRIRASHCKSSGSGIKI